MSVKTQEKKDITFEDFQSAVLNDYRIACESRETSLMGRREVLSGKGSFGIFGRRKRVGTNRYSCCFKKGDFRSSYT